MKINKKAVTIAVLVISIFLLGIGIGISSTGLIVFSIFSIGIAGYILYKQFHPTPPAPEKPKPDNAKPFSASPPPSPPPRTQTKTSSQPKSEHKPKFDELTIYKFRAYLTMLVKKEIKPGKPFFFSPDLDWNDSSEKTLREVMMAILAHLSLPLVLTHFAKFVWKENDGLHNNSGKQSEAAGTIQGDKITVYLSKGYKLTHYAAIIAHECVHYYLRKAGLVLDDEQQNELLTEIAAIYLGFELVYELAYKEIKETAYSSDSYTERTQKLGYISVEEIALINKLIKELPPC